MLFNFFRKNLSPFARYLPISQTYLHLPGLSVLICVKLENQQKIKPPTLQIALLTGNNSLAHHCFQQGTIEMGGVDFEKVVILLIFQLAADKRLCWNR